jgi:hypothetical protein
MAPDDSTVGSTPTVGDPGNRPHRGDGTKKLFPPAAERSVTAGEQLPATEWKPALFLEESHALSFPVPVDISRFFCLVLKIAVIMPYAAPL